MKIAMIGLRGLGDGLGGIEKAVREISTRMVQDGHDVYCYCKAGFSKNDCYEGVNLINIKTYKGKHLETMLYSIKAILHASRQDYDVIHIHALATSCLAWIPKFLFKKKVIITVHGLDWQRAKWGFFAQKILKFGEWASVRFADMTVCVSKSLSTYYKMKYNQDKIEYIPNGCDIDDQQHEELESFPKNSYFLYLGRLVPEKGVHRLIEAFNELETDKKLVIAGPDSDPAYAVKLRKIAGNNKNIAFTGAVYDDNKVRLLANAYMFILPSEIEGLPIALLEAASYGVCTAVSKIPTCEEVVNTNEFPCGFTFTFDKINEIKTVLNISEQSKNLVQALGQKLKHQIKHNYNWDEISKQSLRAYKSA